MRTGLLRPRLHSTQTVSTLLSPTHYWAPWDRRTWLWTLLTSENLGSQEWAVQRPPGEWLLQGLKCWMPCLSLPCWPKPRHFYMLLSSPQDARQMTIIHGCHGCHGQTLIWCYIGMVHVLEGLPSHVPSDRLYSAVLGDIIILLQCLTYSVLHILEF